MGATKLLGHYQGQKVEFLLAACGGRTLGDPAGERVETPVLLVNFRGRRATAIPAISSDEESVA